MKWVDQLTDNPNAFSLTFVRGDIPEGSFGYLARWWCSSCGGPCGEPEYHMTHRQTLEQPEEGEERCPHCGSEECGEHDDPQPMKVIRRYYIHRNPYYREAV